MLISSLKGGNFEIWNEFGQVAYVTSGRDVPEFRTPEKGPRECDGKKIPAVKVSLLQSKSHYIPSIQIIWFIYPNLEWKISLQASEEK